jgi:hypothetical protein
MSRYGRRPEYRGTTLWTIERDDGNENIEAFDVEITYRRKAYDPGRTTGPAELCYPAEGGGVEILEVTHNGQPFEMTEAEADKATLWIEENPEEEDDGYDD